AQVDGLPGSGRLVEEVDAQLRRARRAQAANELHAVAESLRFLAGAEIRSLPELQALEAHCRKAWDTRDLAADREAAGLDAATEAQGRADLLDLALFWVHLRRRVSQGGDAGEVSQTLAEAEKLLGPHPALVRERRLLARPAGEPEPPTPAPAGRTWWEHLTLGQSL